MDKLETSKKWELLGALYKNGVKVKKLEEVLPGWKSAQLEKAIKSYKIRANRNLNSAQKEQNQEPIDMWYELIEKCQQIEGTYPLSERKNRKIDPDLNNFSPLLQKSMLYAACFEEHYQSSNPEEPNYNEIYRYLAQLLAGEEPTQLRPGNASKIVEMMSKLKELLDTKESIQRYLNYITETHSVSFLKPGVDVWSIVEEKKNQEPEANSPQVTQLFTDNDNSSDMKLSSLDENDPQYLVKKEKIILKLSLKQRALAGTISHIPGLNPLEMVLPSLVKPPLSLEHSSRINPKKRKIASVEK